jgi:iron complex transport system substrate-binding protein
MKIKKVNLAFPTIGLFLDTSKNCVFRAPTGHFQGKTLPFLTLFQGKGWVFRCALLILIAIPAHSGADRKNIEIKDDAGRSVVFQRTPQTIVSLSPSNTEILFALGAGKNIVGVTDYCNYPADALKIAKVGGFSEVSFERIAALKPDVIFASQLHISEVVPALTNLGFPVVVIDPEKIASVFDSIRLVGRVIDKEAEAERVVSGLRAKYDALSLKVKNEAPVSVYWEISADRWTIGKGSLLDDLISKAGGKNIASDSSVPWLQLNSEYILKRNPGTIFLADHQYGVNADQLAKRPGWNSIDAVKNKRVVELSAEENDIVSRPGPRIIDALEYIARHLHPALFTGESS